MKTANLEVRLPTCRHCHRPWQPAEGIIATQDYCDQCATDRRAHAKLVFSTRPLSSADFVNGYLLPRRVRVS